jgi:hypothetical protein
MIIAHRFIGGIYSRLVRKSAKRTTEFLLFTICDSGFTIHGIFSRPLHGLAGLMHGYPSTEVLGYFRIVRFADSTLDLNL